MRRARRAVEDSDTPTPMVVGVSLPGVRKRKYHEVWNMSIVEPGVRRNVRGMWLGKFDLTCDACGHIMRKHTSPPGYVDSWGRNEVKYERHFFCRKCLFEVLIENKELVSGVYYPEHPTGTVQTSGSTVTPATTDSVGALTAATNQLTLEDDILVAGMFNRLIPRIIPSEIGRIAASTSVSAQQKRKK